MSYSLLNVKKFVAVKFGRNGGGAKGYCLYRGRKAVFPTIEAAGRVRSRFDKPEDYAIIPADWEVGK